MKLKDMQLRSVKGSEKPVKLGDGTGMYAYVSPSGMITFRMNYKYGGKYKTLTMGRYPEMSLAAARKATEAAKADLDVGRDPMVVKVAKKVALVIQTENTYQVAYKLWLEKERSGWVDEHFEHVTTRQKNDVLPYLGHRPLEEITGPEILHVIERIVQRSNDIAHRALSDIKRVFSIAVIRGMVQHNPARDLVGALPAVKTNNFAAITDPAELAVLLKAIPHAKVRPSTKCALWLVPRVAIRPGDIRRAKWEDIDFKNKSWSFTPNKTEKKLGTQLIVPLATQVVAKLEELKLLTGDGEYLFPGLQKSRPISDGTLNTALVRLGFERTETTVHGFRATFRTIAEEVLNFKDTYLEQQLGHMVKDLHGTAYNRTKHLKQRTSMMQVWADYLDALAEGRDTKGFIQS
jgi:hypothetical protein